MVGIFPIPKTEILPPKPSLPRSSACESDAFEGWAFSERESSRNSHDVARIVADEIDTYRLILSSDIQASLFISAIEKCRQILIDAFQVFCRLPPYRLDSAFDDNVWWASGLAPNSPSFRNYHGHKSPFSLLDGYQPNQDMLCATQENWYSAFYKAADEDSNHKPIT